MQLICRIASPVVALMLATSAVAQWNAEDSGTKSSLRGVHNAAPGVAWASGANGVVLRSEDFGYLWQQCAIPPDAGKLDFRGVWAWDANHAIVMSSGPGSASKLYETTDGCAHWRLLLRNSRKTVAASSVPRKEVASSYTVSRRASAPFAPLGNPDAAGFWDAIAFRNAQQGVLLGDPVNGRFVILRTSDGGQHWTRDDSPGLAADSHGEGAFAASNSALALGLDGSTIYFATGGSGVSRVFRFHSSANNKSGNWNSSKLPLTHGSDGAGAFSISFRDTRHGVVAGGDYKQPNERNGTAAWTSDGGVTWTAASKAPGGYRSAVAWDEKLQAWIAVGPNGSDVSYNDGQTWEMFDQSGWNALSLPWAVGSQGKIATLNEHTLRGHN